MSDYNTKYIIAKAHIQEKIVDLIRLTDDKEYCNIYHDINDNIIDERKLKNKFLDLNEAYDKLLLEASNLQQEKEDITKENQKNKKELQRYKDRYGWLCVD